MKLEENKVFLNDWFPKIKNQKQAQILMSSAQRVLVHPLVIINISDHFTRAKVQKSTHLVVGALMGSQSGRQIELSNSFEIPMKTDLDLDYVNIKKEQCISV